MDPDNQLSLIVGYRYRYDTQFDTPAQFLFVSAFILIIGFGRGLGFVIIARKRKVDCDVRDCVRGEKKKRLV